MVGEDTKIAPDITEEPTDTVGATADTLKDKISAEPTPSEDGGAEGKDAPDTEDAPDAEDGPIDYAELARADMEALRLEFPELRDKTSITELKNPLRYAALRDLGLTPREAYLATSGASVRYDNRSHLRSSVPSGARENADRLGGGELEAARELFSGLSDRELQRLYKKVIK